MVRPRRSSREDLRAGGGPHADCLALAACGPGDRLATVDLALLAIAEVEKVATLRLLDPRGE